MEREIWTQRSTYGFSNAELAMLRKAQRTLEKAFPHKSRSDLQCALHMAFDLSPIPRADRTAEALVNAVISA